jgi:hypothetical protein
MCSLINGTDFFALRAFEFLITKHKNNNSKNLHFFPIPHSFSFSILSLLFHISFIHLISLPSSFSISLCSFLSHFATSIPHVLNWLCLFISLSAPSFLSSSGISSVTPLILLCPDSFFFPFFLACLCLCLFYLALHSSIFLLLLIFPFLHWHIRFSDSIFFFSLQHSTSILHSSLPSSLVTTVTPKE